MPAATFFDARRGGNTRILTKKYRDETHRGYPQEEEEEEGDLAENRRTDSVRGRPVLINKFFYVLV